MSIKNASCLVRIVFIVYQVVRVFRETVLFTVFGYVSHCQQSPTCGTFFIQSCEQHGVLRGIIKTVPRVLRCSSITTAKTTINSKI